MSLIDPVYLMTLMGTTPERRARPASENSFERHMHSALTERTVGVAPGISPSSVDDPLMRNALQGLASLMGKAGAVRADAGKKSDALGALSAQFESGKQGVSAIGYDRNGGTSYGAYQIASRPGTMDQFISFLNGKEPRWAAALKAAGPANTGSTKGDMPDVWRSIARENPERFGELQREFIAATHYKPARNKILAKTGVDMDTLPSAVREALWSTAVQHGAGGAAAIFGRALKNTNLQEEAVRVARRLIDAVYDDRKKHFGSSTSAVQASVRNRMNVEKELALNMLQKDESGLA